MDFLTHSRYLLGDEYRSKLEQAVSGLSHDDLWWRPAEGCNSIGNLLLHLIGNVRQWIVGGVAGEPVTRDRAAEFATRDGADAGALLAALGSSLDDVQRVLSHLTPDDLTQPRHIQGRDVTVQQAVYHVVEHFAMHTGQILQLVKMRAPGTVHFYEDAGGLARPVWKEGGSAPVPPRGTNSADTQRG